MSSARRWATSATAFAGQQLAAVTGHVDALVVLDLGERRTDHVAGHRRLGEAARLLGTREHEQRLGVAAHAGGDVVDVVQRCEDVGILLVPLEPVEVAQETVEQLAGCGDRGS